jgi:GTPase SAR1 family protein
MPGYTEERMLNMGYKQINYEKLSTKMDECAFLLGPETKENPYHYDFKPGLSSGQDADTVARQAENVRKGMFLIVTLGRFSTGKSTLLNAFLHEELLAKKVTAATAVIAYIEYGKRGNVTVHYVKDGNKDVPPKTMTEAEFFKEYTLTAEDTIACEKDGFITKYANVDHAEIQRECKLCRDGTRLVDAPGIDESISRDRITEGVMKRANAILFLISSLQPFTAREKEYIANNFAGQYKKNVFYVFTRFDNVNNASIPELKETVEVNLRPVFTDASGKFDRALYNRRVFFVDGWHAEQLRTTGITTDPHGHRIDVTEEETGVPALEDAINEFLDSDDKLDAVLKGLLGNMTSAYVRAKKETELQYESLSRPLGDLQHSAEAAAAEIATTQQNIESLKQTYASCGRTVYSRIATNMNGVIDDIERNWPEFVSGIPAMGPGEYVRMNMGRLIGIIPGLREKANKKINEIIKPYEERVANYIKQFMDGLNKKNRAVLDDIEKDIKTQTNTQADLVAAVLAHATQTISGAQKNGGKDEKLAFADLIKTAIGVYNGDIDVVVKSAGGKSSWMDFIKSTVTHYFGEIIIYSILGWPALILEALYDIWQIRSAAGQYGTTMLEEYKNLYIQQLKRQFELVRNGGLDETKTPAARVEALSNIIERQFSEAGEKSAAAFRKVIDQVSSKHKELLKRASDVTFNAESEKARREMNQKQLALLISDIHQEMYGRPLDDAQIENLAAFAMKA